MFSLGLIAGIFVGVYITSRHFRIVVISNLKKFVAWLKDCVERNKKIHKQEDEIKKLREDAKNYNFTKKILY